ncbi:MAG: (d)CMP kinase [Gammaproteobacteria bacterium]|nr:MAG: (d)CMP kinase [Gammaproteobacteria bacterium]
MTEAGGEEANRVPVIAIDGPGGVGKGTLSRRLAAHLGFHLLDSGALYRLVALGAEEQGVPLDDEQRLAALAARLDVAFRLLAHEDVARPVLDGRAVGEELRSERCGDNASRIAGYPRVRAALLARQRAFRRPPGLVADGRDMGSLVFPHAELKIFLTASLEERAQRRYKQLIAKGIGVSLAPLLGEISARDRRDRERSVAPMKPASDAVVIDTTARGIDDVFEHVMKIASERGVSGP